MLWLVPVYAGLADETIILPASTSVIWGGRADIWELESFLGLFGVSRFPQPVLSLLKGGLPVLELELGVENEIPR